MASNLMKFMCGECINIQESSQAKPIYKYVQEVKLSDTSILSPKAFDKQKSIYSFKYQAFRKGPKVEKTLLHSKSIQYIPQVKQIKNSFMNVRNIQTNNFYSKSPEIRFCYSPQPAKKIQKQFQIPGKLQLYKERQQVYKAVPLISRIEVKKVKNMEEETEYSTKNSQISFKYSPQSTQASNFFQTKSNGFKKQINPVIFQQQFEQSFNLSQVQDFSNNQNKNTFAFQQIKQKITPVFQFSPNPQTFKSINTDTQIKSIKQSQIPNPIPYLNLLKQENYKLSELSSNNKDIQSLTISPRQNFNFTSPQKHRYQNINTNLFYSSKCQNSQYQRVSVLNIAQNDYIKKSPQKLIQNAKISAWNSIQHSFTSQKIQQQQLRDVIDNTFVQQSRNGNGNGKILSPFISHQSSMKKVNNDEKKNKFVSFKSISPVHSRKSSKQLVLLTNTRANLGRTNTIQSMQSYLSEKSCLDIKFMQKMRARKGLSKLITQKE